MNPLAAPHNKIRIAAVLFGFGAMAGLTACAEPGAVTPPAVAALPAPVVAPVPVPKMAMVAPAPVDDAAVAEDSSTGLASWYRASRRLHRTSSGALLDDHALTAASSVLPLGTLVRIGRLDDDRSVIVTVNDRMPRNHRLIDVSEIAARELGLTDCGVATVTVTPIEVASAP